MNADAKKGRDVLAWAALLAALGVTASAEWQLAVAVGFGPYVAAGVPAALDIYAVRALRARRDVAAVVGAMIAVQALAHLVAARLLTVSVPLVVAVSTIAPLVLWRVHRIGHGEPDPTTPAPAAEPQENTAVVHLDTSASSQVTPPAPDRPAIEAPVPVSEVDTEADTEASTDAEPLDADAAREVIEAAFRDGLSIRAAAARATRSPSYVQKVYAQLREADTAPIPGQLAIDAA